jgi:hypothetical protein
LVHTTSHAPPWNKDTGVRRARDYFPGRQRRSGHSEGSARDALISARKRLKSRGVRVVIERNLLDLSDVLTKRCPK